MDDTPIKWIEGIQEIVGGCDIMLFKESVSEVATRNSGKVVDSTGEFQQMSDELLQKAVEIKMELNNKYHTPSEVRKIFSKLT